MTDTGYFPTKILLATDGSEDASAATRASDGPVLIYPRTPECLDPGEVESQTVETPDESSFWSKLFDDWYRSGR